MDEKGYDKHVENYYKLFSQEQKKLNEAMFCCIPDEYDDNSEECEEEIDESNMSIISL